jgi:hypothetical protein
MYKSTNNAAILLEAVNGLFPEAVNASRKSSALIWRP